MSFLSDSQIVINELNAYFKESRTGKKKVLQQRPLKELVQELDLDSLVKEGKLQGKKLECFMKKYLDNTTRLHHPHYLAHQVAVPDFLPSLASLVDGFINNPMNIYEMGPAAATIEFFLINFFLEQVGWLPAPLPPSKLEGEFGGGILTHGGSLANLTAIVCACNHKTKFDGDRRNLVLMVSEISHYSITKVAKILGIDVYKLKTDETGKIYVNELPKAYNDLKKQAKEPIALVANACNTPVGTYDALSEIADFCQEQNLWLHVDGAHGASVLLSSKHRDLVKGIEKADSLTWDAHKLMRVPSLCTLLLTKNHQTLEATFSDEASYLFHPKEQPGFDFMPQTFECTKAGLSLKLFFALAQEGKDNIANYIEQVYAITYEAFLFLKEQSDLICPVKPESNILCFRFQEDLNHLKLRDQLLFNKYYYISSTDFRQISYLRLVISSPYTQLAHIKKLIDELRELKKVNSKSNPQQEIKLPLD